MHAWWSVGWWGWCCLAVAVAVAAVDAAVRRHDRRIWDTLPGRPPNRDLGPYQLDRLRGTFMHDPAAVITIELAVRGHLRIHDPGGKDEPVVIRRVRDADPADLRPYEAEFLEVLGDEAVPSEELGDRLHRLVYLATHEEVRKLPWVRTYMHPVWPDSSYRDACGTHSFAAACLGAAGVLLAAVDLLVRETFGSLAMAGVAVFALGLVALARRLRLDELCHGTLDRVIDDYTGMFGYSAAVRKRPHENLPYAFSLNQYHWLEWYAGEHVRDAGWYSFGGADEALKERFVALGGMFKGGYPRPAYVRSPSGRPARSRATSGGFAGGGHGDGGGGFDSGGGHGHGGGHGGGADGGGHGGSW
ncbi:hypothetical protein [Actinomadura gamaensis]|uniref:TIGR04222 domain-containing membrane protein n=1 Tax=Actinomadura gamaensis TaxID=1763541 RepID=A0ABV9TZ75_9ACTN